MKRTYQALTRLPTLAERFDYLKLGGEVGAETFGSRRFLNQDFYRSNEWRSLRNHIRVRDHDCDLAVRDFPIRGIIHIHHINPITQDDLLYGSDALVDPDNLITVSHHTHNLIHYGDERQLPRPFVERTPGDTKEW